MPTTRKGKAGEVRTICLLLCQFSYDHDKTAALYKFNIEIGPRSDGEVLVLDGDDDLMISPMATFFEQDWRDKIYRVGCCFSGSKLFLVPNEREFDVNFTKDLKDIDCPDYLDELRLSSTKRIYPLQYDFLTNQTVPFVHYPRAPKVMPLVISINNKVYVLSVNWIGGYQLLEPTFEAYDPTTGSWEPLPQPPFYKRSLDCAAILYNYKRSHDCAVFGYAVVTVDNGEVFIIVNGCFSKSYVGFFSYNVSARLWKPVSVAEGAKYPMWNGETVVIGGHIYVYTLSDTCLDAFSIHYSEETGEISVGRPFVVTGLEMRELPEKVRTYEMPSGTIGKIGDRLLCVAYTAFPCFLKWQSVVISIVKIREDDPSHCDTLASYMFGLPKEGKIMNSLLMTSCFVLAPGMEHIEGCDAKHPLKRRITADDYLDHDRVIARLMKEGGGSLVPVM